MTPVRVSEDQVLYFRSKRGHLVGRGAPNVVEAARSILGAQSQQLHPSLLAISMRTRSRPTLSQVKQALFSESRSLVRVWGQRDTIHVYDADTHWRNLIAALQFWSPGGRDAQLPSRAAINKAMTIMENGGGIATRSDVLPVTPRALVKQIQERSGLADSEAKRFAAGRLFWALIHLGHASIGEKVGSEQAYVLRRDWFPELPWPEVEPEEAAAQLTRDYLAVYGPATAKDVAHFFGGRVTDARKILGRIADELTPVSCDHRDDLFVLTKDLRPLRTKPAASATAWPLRLLPLWESMMMGHADKSWTVPKESERKQVWRSSARVSAVVMERGRVIATWSQKATKKRLSVQIQSLSGWKKSRHLKPAEREANAIAAHLELADVEVTAD